MSNDSFGRARHPHAQLRPQHTLRPPIRGRRLPGQLRKFIRFPSSDIGVHVIAAPNRAGLVDRLLGQYWPRADRSLPSWWECRALPAASTAIPSPDHGVAGSCRRPWPLTDLVSARSADQLPRPGSAAAKRASGTGQYSPRVPCGPARRNLPGHCNPVGSDCRTSVEAGVMRRISLAMALRP